MVSLWDQAGAHDGGRRLGRHRPEQGRDGARFDLVVAHQEKKLSEEALHRLSHHCGMALERARQARHSASNVGLVAQELRGELAAHRSNLRGRTWWLSLSCAVAVQAVCPRTRERRAVWRRPWRTDLLR